MTDHIFSLCVGQTPSASSHLNEAGRGLILTCFLVPFFLVLSLKQCNFFHIAHSSPPQRSPLGPFVSQLLQSASLADAPVHNSPVLPIHCRTPQVSSSRTDWKLPSYMLRPPFVTEGFRVAFFISAFNQVYVCCSRRSDLFRDRTFGHRVHPA